jgi:molybdopterin-containing oxidoreductase family membrane subunit
MPAESAPTAAPALPPPADRPAEPRRFWALAAVAAVVTLAGLYAAHVMETEGHVVTGMTNEIVWGTPHVFAIFMIVAASGVLNVASVASVFGQAPYKPHAPLAALLCAALLAGGLFVLMLDLGRPERMIVAATHYNFTSVFAWNVFLYTGMFAAVAIYLWAMLSPRMKRWSTPAGVAALVWRFVLTTGTGAIFAFLVARQAYASALLPPLFIVLSLAWGLAVFIVVKAVSRRPLAPDLVRRVARLLGVFVALALYLVVVLHLTNAYFARQVAYERFVLLEGGVYPLLFWAGFVAVGSVLPMVLVWHPKLADGRAAVAAAAAVIVGAFALLYVFIIGGQAFPLEIFPGYAVASSFRDGAVASYAPRWPEVVLGIGGVALAWLVTLIGTRALPIVASGGEPLPGGRA